MSSLGRILVVEDDRVLREALCANLTEEGYAVLSATQGEEALYLLERLPVQLVLSDLEMPVMDGRELLDALRVRSASRQVPVVLMAETYHPAVAAADWFLTKPVRKGDLLGALCATLAKRPEQIAPA